MGTLYCETDKKYSLDITQKNLKFHKLNSYGFVLYPLDKLQYGGDKISLLRSDLFSVHSKLISTFSFLSASHIC